MKAFTAIAALAAASVAFATPSPVEKIAARASSGALPTVTTKGNAFFAGSTRFYVRGIDYQPGGSSKLVDPLADSKTCERDIAEFKKLGINTVRIYSVDNSVNHDDCMNALAAAGIYLVLDVNTPLYSLNRANPGPSYNPTYLQNIFATIDAFQGYSNTLAFFSANEVLNAANTSAAAPWVKAVTRDMKSYMSARGYRHVPVGYSAADVPENRLEMAHYMNCGTDDERSDFFAFNDYSYCSPSSFTQSGWDQKVKNFTGYSLPLFLSEYGCVPPSSPRTWEESGLLMNPEMTGVYSGGLAYEYSQEENNFGMVKINSDGTITELTNFAAYQKELKANPIPSGDGGYSTSGSASTCPSKSTNWAVDNDDLPAIPDGAKKFFTQGAGKGVGLSGTGSQNAGGGSTATASPGSGSVTAAPSSSATKSSAAMALTPMSHTPYIAGTLAMAVTLIGSALFGAMLMW